MSVKLMRITLVIFIALATFAHADEKKIEAVLAPNNYISAEDTASIIRNKNPGYVIIDIQPKADFDKHHLQGAVSTCAFPANTPEMHEKLKAGLDAVKADQKIIVVCPRGGGGAKNTVNYYRSIGIRNDRLLILENGQTGWPQSLSDVLVMVNNG